MEIINKENILRNFCKVFDGFDIPYVLIGAYAVSSWGVVRATRDIDFLARIPSGIIDTVREKFAEKGFEVDLVKGDADDPIRGVLKLIYKGEDVIDVLLGIKGISDNIYIRAVRISIMGVKIPVISPEDLIIMKLLAGGPVDIDDARKILKIMGDKIDFAYLEKQCRVKGLDLEKIQ